MQLTDEEARVILEFRQRNAVRNAFNEAIDSCRALLRAASERFTSTDTLVLEALDQAMQALRKGNCNG